MAPRMPALIKRTAYLSELKELKDIKVVKNPMRNQHAIVPESPLSPNGVSWYKKHVYRSILSATKLLRCAILQRHVEEDYHTATQKQDVGAWILI